MATTSIHWITAVERARGTRGPRRVACAALAAATLLGPAALKAQEGEASPAAPNTEFSVLPLPPAVDRLAVVEEMRPARRSSYLELVTREAEQRGLPPAVADAVTQVESAYDPGAVGKAGEFGLMQVRPTTAAMLGFKGPLVHLFEPATNIRYGVAYLAEAWRLTNGDLCRALMKYRAGHGEERFTTRSVEYCRRARDHLAAIGSPLASVALPSVTAPSTAQPFRRVAGSRLAASSVDAPWASQTKPDPSRVTELYRKLWAEHVARVRKIDAAIARIVPGG